MLAGPQSNFRVTPLCSVTASCDMTVLPVPDRLGDFTALNSKSPHFLLAEPLHFLILLLGGDL